MAKVNISINATSLEFAGGVIHIQTAEDPVINIDIFGEFEVGRVNTLKEPVPKGVPKGVPKSPAEDDDSDIGRRGFL